MKSYQLPIEHRAVIRVVLKRIAFMVVIFCIALIVAILIDTGVV